MQPRHPRHPRHPHIRAVRREIAPPSPPRKPGRIDRRLGAALLLAALAGGGWYLWQQRSGTRAEVEPVVAIRTGTVAEALEVDGLIIRHEQVVTAPVAGQVRRLAAEGERVRVGAPVVEIGPSSAQPTEATGQTAGEGQTAGDLAARAGTSAGQREYDRLSVEIYRLAVALSNAKYTGQAEQVAALEADLDRLSRRQNRLLAELPGRNGPSDGAQPEPTPAPAPAPATPSEGATPVETEVAGIVLYLTDGLETILDPGESDKWTPSWLRSLPYPDLKKTGEEAVAVGQPLFKVVDDLDLELIVVVPSGRLTPSQRTLMAEQGVTLRISGQEEPTTARLRGVVEEGEELLLHLTVPMPASQALRVRRMRVTLLLDSFQGMIVPRSAIDVVDGQTGVWARAGGEYRFSPVRVLGGNRDEVAVEGDLPPDGRVLRVAPPPGR